MAKIFIFVKETKKIHILDYFWHRESNFQAKILQSISVISCSGVTALVAGQGCNINILLWLGLNDTPYYQVMLKCRIIFAHNVIYLVN